MKKPFKKETRIYFVGIGGTGMSALAWLAREMGYRVGGSDRDLSNPLISKLRDKGIKIFLQDGTGPEEFKPDMAIYSTAVEKSNTDLRALRKFKVLLLHRAQFLSQITKYHHIIAVAGTSGKSTTVGMIQSILVQAGKNPTVVNGAQIIGKDYSQGSGNARLGKGKLAVLEIDESDGSLKHFSPFLSVLLNLSQDHKQTHEVARMFQALAKRTSKGIIWNQDDLPLKKAKLQHKNSLSFSKSNGLFQLKNVRRKAWGTQMDFLHGPSISLSVPGDHNVENALAAIAAMRMLRIPWEAIQKGLRKFRGIRRRMEKVGVVSSLTVIDDFAHNPAKIQASLQTLHGSFERIIAVYQPHGYGPTRFLLQPLAKTFSECLSPGDALFLLPIYDMGGTADRSISSMDLWKEIKKQKGKCKGKALKKREAFWEEIKKIPIGKKATALIIMGARDPSLPSFIREILKKAKGFDL